MATRDKRIFSILKKARELAIEYKEVTGKPLNRYLDDGDLAIDNNAAERALRGVAVGRKNYLFAGSNEGGERAAILYSVVESCKRHDLDPFEYMRDVKSTSEPTLRIYCREYVDKPLP